MKQKQNSNTVFRILNTNTQKFIKGTPSYLKDDSFGRIFKNLGAVRTFLTGTVKSKTYSSDWLIIEYDLTIKSAKYSAETVSAKTLLKVLNQ